MSGRQLNIFKGRRQRGTPIPRTKEFALHCALAATVRRWISPQWKFSHIPLGEKRDVVTAMRLQRMGTVAGLPDFIFIGPMRSVFWLELKRPGGGGRLSEAQRDMAAHLVACGFPYLCTDDLKDAIDTLKDFGILRSNIQVQ